MVVVSVGDVNWARQVAALGFAVRGPATKALAPRKAKTSVKGRWRRRRPAASSRRACMQRFPSFVKQAAKIA